MYDEDRDDGQLADGSHFRDPGGRSALRAGPRIYSCPNCRAPRRLTKRDKELGYQCDSCADRAEGRYVGGDY